MDSEFILQGFVNLLSLITISSCLVLKVPQIMNLHKLKTAAGMNKTALAMELFSYSTVALYNYCNSYSLLSYLEYPIIIFQELILIYLVLKYSETLHTALMRFAVIFYFFTVIGFIVGFLPSAILTALVPLCTPISGASKVIFMLEMMTTKKSDSVSLLTWVISIATNAIRVFTVYMDSADKNLLLNFTISTALSCGVLFTAWWFKQKKIE